MKIKIAVVIDSNGNWYSCGGYERGYYHPDDDDLQGQAEDSFDDKGDSHVVWVEADVPLPGESKVFGFTNNKKLEKLLSELYVEDTARRIGQFYKIGEIDG